MKRKLQQTKSEQHETINETTEIEIKNGFVFV